MTDSRGDDLHRITSYNVCYTKLLRSFAPSFGYDLCARRLRDADIANYDLSNWRVAGIGAEMIRPQTLELFADKLAACGFDSRASYNFV